MKKGWEYKKLGEVCCKIKNVKWKDCPNKNYQYIDLTAVDRETLRILETVSINAENAPSRAKQIVNEGDVIFATTRPTLRRFSIIPHNYNKSLCSTGFCVLRPNNDLLSKWIFYNFYTNSFYKYIEPLQNGANYPAITDSCVKDYIIPIPPLSEQKEIVEYLDSSFAKIDKLKENAAKNLEEAKALFQSALKDALEPKEGWEKKTLIKEFSLKSGDNLSAKKQIKGPYDVYGGNGVTGSHIEYNLSGKNILIGRVGALCGNIHFVNAKIWVTDNAFIVKDISEHWHMDFLTYELKYLNLNQYASQTAQPVISNKSMKDVMIMLPPLSEQQSIVSFLDSLNEKVNTLQQNYSRICNECDVLKQAILRQVFE